MNKKNLSVVMAGAMLATSVAPVLAAETTTNEILDSQKKTLVHEITTLMESKLVSNETKLKENNMVPANALASNNTTSVYGVQVFDSTGKAVSGFDNIVYDINTLESGSMLENALSVGNTVKVYEREYKTFLGQNILSELPKVDETADVYTKADINNLYEAITEGNTFGNYNFGKNKYIAGASINSNKDTVTIKLSSLKDIKDPTSNNTITLTVGDKRLNFGLGLDSDGNLVNTTTGLQKVTGFLVEDTYKAGKEIDNSEPKVYSETKIVEAEDSTKKSYAASDLYDGFALTAGATEIINDIANEKYTKSFTYSMKSSVNPDRTLDQMKSETNLIELNQKTGIATVNIKLTYKGVTIKEYSISSSNAKELQSLMKLLLKGDFNVGIIGGNNRYETAVNVAKAQGISTFDSGYQQNIILVNGTSLVDGLAAAPLATKLLCTDKTNSTKNAPVLLTESDKLSSATKEYLEELTEEITPAARKYTTINLVGGKSVLSASLVKELEDMGFTVKRYGGDDREETSLKVAEAIGNTNDAFVVGANGEADAMSIASVAVEKSAPIIVSSVHGLSEDAIEFIDSKYNNTPVTIVGGESVVSKSEETAIDETIDALVTRVSGENRFETNAKVINKYYSGKSANGVVLVKDGMSSKDELIDALSAANYAATMDAPIVLASTSLKDSQKNELLKVNVSNSGKAVQVGIGAERTVLETIAGLFDISNL